MIVAPTGPLRLLSYPLAVVLAVVGTIVAKHLGLGGLASYGLVFAVGLPAGLVLTAWALATRPRSLSSLERGAPHPSKLLPMYFRDDWTQEGTTDDLARQQLPNCSDAESLKMPDGEQGRRKRISRVAVRAFAASLAPLTLAILSTSEHIWAGRGWVSVVAWAGFGFLIVSGVVLEIVAQVSTPDEVGDRGSTPRHRRRK